MNNSTRVRLGVIGFGRIVELVHLPVLKKVESIEVAAIYDITPQRLEFGPEKGFPVVDSLDELMSGPIDAVLIATPPNSHFELAASALRQGKHVLVEKPVTRTADEAERLLELADAARLTVSVFHNRRFDRDFAMVKQILEEQNLGQILFVHRTHHSFMSLASFGVKSFHPNWREEIGFGGGALLDWGVHLADQLLQLNLGEPDRVTHARMDKFSVRSGDAEEFVQAAIRLTNGILLVLEVNCCSNAEPPLWIVGGEEATVQISPAFEAMLMKKGAAPRSLELSWPTDKGPELIYSSFADSVLRGTPPAVRLEEAFSTMKMISQIQEISKR